MRAPSEASQYAGKPANLHPVLAGTIIVHDCSAMHGLHTCSGPLPGSSGIGRLCHASESRLKSAAGKAACITVHGCRRQAEATQL